MVDFSRKTQKNPLTLYPHSGIMHIMKNTIINALSILAAKRFVRKYRNTSLHSDEVLGALDTYRFLRRKLPKDDTGRHLGNHAGSKQKPFRATQGESVAVLSSLS